MNPFHKEILVIGYGSTLRGDDAVGRLVVERVSERSLPNVTTISVTQLVPELAEQIAKAQAVIFVDACAENEGCGVEAREISRLPVVGDMSHTAAPQEILALASACFDREPRAWLVAVPSTAFELTDGISSMAHLNVQSATRAVERLIKKLSKSEVVHA